MSKTHHYYVYMMTNNSHSTLYTGVTNNIERRVYEHKNKTADSFTKKYNCAKLIYLEDGNDIQGAIQREKELKGWKRFKKDALVSDMNPEWVDLSFKWYK